MPYNRATETRKRIEHLCETTKAILVRQVALNAVSKAIVIPEWLLFSSRNEVLIIHLESKQIRKLHRAMSLALKLII
jgi:hypothetical protein